MDLDRPNRINRNDAEERKKSGETVKDADRNSLRTKIGQAQMRRNNSNESGDDLIFPGDKGANSLQAKRESIKNGIRGEGIRTTREYVSSNPVASDDVFLDEYHSRHGYHKSAMDERIKRSGSLRRVYDEHRQDADHAVNAEYAGGSDALGKNKNEAKWDSGSYETKNIREKLNTDYNKSSRKAKIGSQKKRRKRSDELDTRGAVRADGFSHITHRRKQHIRDFVVTTIIVMLALLITGTLYFIRSNFCVSEIEIVGSLEYSSEQILSTCNIQKGDYIFGYDEEEIRDKLSSIPNISVISIEKDYPDRIVIHISDREPRAAIAAVNGTYAIIASDGCVMSMGASSADGLIIIRGLTLTGFGVETYINRDSSDARAAAVVNLINEVNASSLAEYITAIDVSNSACVKIEAVGEFIMVLGDCVEAAGNVQTAAKAYQVLIPDWPLGGIINVFTDSDIVDFTPNRHTE